MIRSLKVLGLALVAALAMTAVAASAASAATFHSEASSTTLSGSQVTAHVFTTEVGPVVCKTATLAGSQSGTTSETWTITPTYKECVLRTIFGDIAVTVNFNGCDYKFNASGLVHIECPAGKTVVISGPGCTVTVPAQTVKNGVAYTNTGASSGRDIDIDATGTGINHSFSGFTCGSGSDTTNATYEGETTMTGSAGIWLS